MARPRVEAELARWPAAGRGPGIALDDEPTLDELADPRCDDRPPQTGPVPELGPRSRAPQADLVEDQDEGIERDVRDRHVHGAILGATFALDEPKSDHR
jgi:hypothetical protein